MEVVLRTRKARRPGGGEVTVVEYCQMVDHSPLRNGTDWVPGPRRYALESGQLLRKVDDATFQDQTTGDILIIVP